jgi:hypothetical protein
MRAKDMGAIRTKIQIAIVGLSLVLAGQGRAQDYQPEALQGLLNKVAVAAAQGRRVVVMFDLDDTLINTRERNQRIFKDFASQADIQSMYPDESKKLLEVQVNQIHYLLSDTMSTLAITSPEFIKAAMDFWLAKFFTNEYCQLDKPNPGAVRYVKSLVRAGATVVYLTGRDIPRMGDGTKANLVFRGFPLDDTNAVLIMKPDPKMDDLAFKISQFDSIRKMGEMDGAFENEPANIDAMNEAFPNAISVFLDTLHSPKPVTVNSDVVWVMDFYTGHDLVTKNKEK